MTEMRADEPWRERYRNMRVLEVLRVQRVTPQMQRVTLGGYEIAGIKDAPNVKLVLPPRGASNPVWPIRGAGGKMAMPDGHPDPVVRTYSLRRLDRVAGEMDIDFVMHGPGAASTWAEQARPGDKIGIGGPAGPEVRPADFYLLAGDHTALPAISRILETLPDDAQGQAFVAIPDAGEQQSLKCPPGVALRWICSSNEQDLIEAVRSMPWPDGQRVYAWMAGESNAVRALRSYVRDEKKLGRGEFLAIGYWRRGMSEPEYHEQHNHDRGEDFYYAIRDELEHAHHDHSH